MKLKRYVLHIYISLCSASHVISPISFLFYLLFAKENNRLILIKSLIVKNSLIFVI